MQRKQRALIGTLLGILGLLVVTLAVLVVTVLGQREATVAAKPTAAPNFTPTPVLNISPSQGWVETTPMLPFARTVAFGTNDPLTGYTCGSQGVQLDGGSLNNQVIMLQFSRTTDGGRTWQTPQTLPFGQGYGKCKLQVDPADAKDVLIGRIKTCDVGPCTYGDYAYIRYEWYRSGDGGQTWNPLSLPASAKAMQKKGYEINQVFSWYGGTLYDVIEPLRPGAYNPLTIPKAVIAVSRSEGAFTDISSPALYSATGSVDFRTITPVFIANDSVSTIYQNFTNNKVEGVSTKDGGTTWTKFIPIVEGAALNYTLSLKAQLDATLYAGIALAGSVPSLIKSTDEGHTWTPLQVPPPSGFSGNDTLFIPPDGTLYLGSLGITKPSKGIARLAPGATVWQMVSVETAQSPHHTLIAISWDNTKRTVALWSESVTTTISTDVVPGPIEVPTAFGLAYHSAVPEN